MNSKIPKSEIISKLALGSFRMSGSHFGPYDQREGALVLRKAYEMGISCFDTAHFYGKGASDRLLGKIFAKEIKRNRDSIKLYAKGGLSWHGNTVIKDSSLKALKTALEASLETLNCDYLDCFFLHYPDPERPLEESIEALISFQAQDEIKKWGLCNLSISQLDEIDQKGISLEGVPFQLSYNLLAPNRHLLEKAKDLGMKTLIYSPLAEGLLGTSKSALGAKGLSQKDFRHQGPYYSTPSFLDKRDLLEKEALSEGLSITQYALNLYLEHPLIDQTIIGPRTMQQLTDLLD